MSKAKKACVVFVAGLEDKASFITAKLNSDGYEVCLHQASEEETMAARDGAANINEKLAECLRNSNICVFLIDQEDQYDGIGLAASQAGAMVIGLLAGPGAVASGIIDDIAEAVMPMDSKNLDDALQGKDVWEGSDGKPINPRKIPRQKCQ